MSPPTEQLLDEYLGRLSAAARGRLAPDDRRALVMRTRYFIETEAGRATAPGLAAFLNELGDPAGIVDTERARLARARGEPLADRPKRRWRQRWQASWQWPTQQPARPQLITSLMAAAGDEEQPRVPGAGSEQNGAAPANGAVRARPSWPNSGAGTMWQDGHQDRQDPGASDTQVISGVVMGVDPAPADTGPAWPDGRVARLAMWIFGRFRTQPVESWAATLMGIGGAAFPPVWLLGAGLALLSRVWDYRDKWTGLALPVLATVTGTVAGVCLTASQALGHDVHNGWIFADVLSRVAAFAGAGYLAWRAVHGRRADAAPPWNKPHKVG